MIAKNEQEQNERRRAEQREKVVRSLMEKTGWTHEYALATLRDARKRIGMGYSEYVKYEFYDIPVKEQEKKYRAIKEEKERKARLKEERAAKKREVFISQVMQATGWDRDHTIEKITQSINATGTSYEHYAIYRFWELTEEEQKEYFSKGDADKLKKKYNKDPELLKVFMNKDLFCTKFEEYLGRKWMSTTDMDFPTFRQKFADKGKIIYKPRALSGGHGVQVFEFNDKTIKSVYNTLRDMPTGIIEEYVIQHAEMQKMSLNSVNTIRVVTIQTYDDVPGVEKNKVHFVYMGMRMGQGKSYVDNLHSGGMMACINVDTGIVETNAADFENKIFEYHPDTGVQIKGFKIPFFNEIKQLIEKAGEGIPGYLGWDVAITENGPILIEVNTHPGADGLQTPFVPMKKGMRYVIAKYLGEPEAEGVEEKPAEAKAVEEEVPEPKQKKTGDKTIKQGKVAVHDAPEIPYGTSISSITREGIEFYWKKPEAAIGYEVFRSYEKEGPLEWIAVVRRRDIGTYIDAEFDRGRKKIFYFVRSFIDREDGTRVFSPLTEPTVAEFREEFRLEREVTYLYSGSSRKNRALYGWGEMENIEWSSDNEAVATVSAEGEITAVAAGECTIRCISRELNKKATARVVVDRKATKPLAEIVSRYHFNDAARCWENPQAQKTDDAVIMMAGDMMCGKRQMEKQYMPLRGWNFNASYTYAKDITALSDFAIGNLETLLAAGWPYMKDEVYIDNKNNCNAPARYLDAVRYGGFDAVAMANNHNCDGEKRALLETIQQVDEYQLARTGVFADANADRFFIVNVNGIKVGFLAYVSAQTGYNGKDAYWAKEDVDTMLNTFSASKAKNDVAACRAAGAEFVVVYMHWGFKNFRKTVQHQVNDAQRVADAGADYIVGGNPHVIQQYAVITAKDGRAVPCIYSTGNFQSVMNQIEGNRDSVIMRIRLKRDQHGRVYLAENNYIPCHTYINCHGKPWAPVSVSENFNVGVKKEARKKFYDNIAAAIGDQIEAL